MSELFASEPMCMDGAITSLWISAPDTTVVGDAVFNGIVVCRFCVIADDEAKWEGITTPVGVGWEVSVLTGITRDR